MGNVTRDPETRYTPKGTAVCEVGLAINRNWTDDQGQKKTETTFVDVTFWARVAEVVQKYVKKGDPLFVDGRLQLESWDDKQTGQKRTKLKVVGENIQLLGGKPQSSNEPTPSAGLQEQRAHHAQASAASRPTPKDPDLDAEPDDIPFKASIRRDVRNNRLNRTIF